MNYEEFKQYVADNIKSYLPSSMNNAEVQIRQITKNNDRKLDGISILTPDVNITPTLYLNEYYQEYITTGKDIHEIMSDISTTYLQHMPTTSINMDELLDWNYMKDHIFIKTINVEKNEQLLKNVPHFTSNDMACTYHIQVNSGQEGVASFCLRNEHLDMVKNFDLSMSELRDHAIKNTQDLFPEKIENIGTIVNRIFEENIDPESAAILEDMFTITPPENPPMLVITNSVSTNGASTLFYPGLKDKIAEMLGTSQYHVLPSSIHEFIVVPKEGMMDAYSLQYMVQDINGSQVKPDEVLSDNVYSYDANTKELTVAGPGAEKQNKKEIDRIVHKLKAAKINPNMRIIKHMQKLNHIVGYDLEPKEIESLSKNKDFLKENDNQKLVKSITQDMKALDMTMVR